MARQSTQDAAAKTINDYLDAACALLHWMAEHTRIKACPLSRKLLRIDGKEIEPARKRRAFTDEECRRLLEKAGDFKPIILTALLTGLRRSELKALKWLDVRLDAVRPFLNIRASTTKNGKPAAFHLTNDLVDELRKINTGTDESAAVFTHVPNMRRDWRKLLQAAEVAYIDAQARQADFHALRHTFNTNLARGGVGEAAHKRLMRVTDRRLIDKTYMDAAQLDLTDAVSNLPRYGQIVAAEVIAATEQMAPNTPSQKWYCKMRCANSRFKCFGVPACRKRSTSRRCESLAKHGR